MAEQRRRISLAGVVVIGAILAFVAYMGRGYYRGAMTIHQLLTENKQLKQAITNLTEENQIGYAKVIEQQEKDVVLVTTIKFVETARDDKLTRIL